MHGDLVIFHYKAQNYLKLVNFILTFIGKSGIIFAM